MRYCLPALCGLITLIGLITLGACQKQVNDQQPLKYLANGTWRWSADTINGADVLTACKADDTITFHADRTVDQDPGTQLCSDGNKIVTYSVSSGGATLSLIAFDGSIQNYAIRDAADSVLHLAMGKTNSGITTYEYLTLVKNQY